MSQTKKYVDLLIITGDTTDHVPESEIYKKITTSRRLLGVAKAAWAARQHGYSAQAIHHQKDVSLEQTIAVCTPFVGPKTIIGIGTTFLHPVANWLADTDNDSPLKHTFDDSTAHLVKLVTHLRSLYNNKVLVGGAIAYDFVDIFKADYCITGQSENELPKLLDKIKNNGLQKKPYDWDIKRCTFRYDKTDFIQPKEVLPYELARGCIFKCKFCSFDLIGKKSGTFEKSMDSVREDFIYNYKELGVNHYYMTADTFNDDDERMNRFCDMVETLPFEIKYTGYFRLDLLHRFQNTARRLYETGLSGCNFGVETFHPLASKAIGKPFNGKKAKEFLPFLHKNIFNEDVFICTTNIVGLPHETPEDLKETSRWYADHPFIQPQFAPLRLNDPTRVSSDVKLSEFDQSFKKYGYHFPHADVNKWKSEWMDHQQAAEITQEMWYHIATHPKAKVPIEIAGWSCMLFFSALDITPKQAWEKGWYNVIRDAAPVLHRIRSNYNEQLRLHALS